MKNKWNDKEAKKLISFYSKKGVNIDLALRIYSTRLLGKDPNVVLHGGGNTSVKIDLKINKSVIQKVLYVKGSGMDMSNIDINGFPALELENLQKLQKRKKMNDF